MCLSGTLWTHSICSLQLNLFNWIEGWHLVYTPSTTQSTIIDAGAARARGEVATGEGFRACLATPLFHSYQFVNGPAGRPAAADACADAADTQKAFQ